ncbi:MAG: hypothetical protein GXN93_02585 [Candidatus Diapherotrites archaeon]|nr:hypothetical protein [Candidatus Diapherotrites archaeon]
MADLSYVKGRLEGLFELVTLLKDVVHGNMEGSPEMLQKMVDHVYVELGEILDVLGSSAAASVEKKESPIVHKVQEAKQSQSGPVKAKDVLSELLTKGDE